MKITRIALILGTRPEAIKLAPIVRAVEKSSSADADIIFTGQHRQMATSIFDWFDIEPKFDLDLMVPGQQPQQFLARSLSAIDELLDENTFDVVLVQGDTTTALAGALAAFHHKIPVGHVEAGLRTDNIYSPFPEEANRNLISRIARWHFAPTDRAAAVLRDEKAPGDIHKVGNTVVDALHLTREKLPAVDGDAKPIVLITAHRRENFGRAMDDTFRALGELARHFPDIDFVFPMHRNPKVREAAGALFDRLDNFDIIEPVDYPEMIGLMQKACLIISDSGGIQEEAASFSAPILITRENTERPEVIEAGIGELVGTDYDHILERGRFHLNGKNQSRKKRTISNPFGDGKASQRIVDIVSGAHTEQIKNEPIQLTA